MYLILAVLLCSLYGFYIGRKKSLSLVKKEDIKNLNTSWPLPSNKQPIILVGAGGIVNDAHLPAYKKSGFDVQGIFDPIKEKSEKLAANGNTFVFAPIWV